jgi:DnaJ-domain-containing protein 1
VQPARVRFHFLKASRVVHPDRNNTASDEQKFIATAVFNTLEQAYRVFESAELNK